MFLVGLIAGAGFNFASTSISNSMSPGKLYAIDLFGSFLGAFLTSVFILPLFGIHNALLTIAVLKLISLFLLYSILSFTVNRKSVSQREEG
jgi:membrane protein implicated in regulation of membrane protease activity